jgi:hypothetical protein
VRPFEPVPCWGAVDAALGAEIVALWTRAGVIQVPGEAERRAPEAVCTARDGEGRLVAVATAQARLIPFLGETLYYLRLFVTRDARAAWLPARLLRTAQDVLAAHAASAAPSSPAIGIFLELENPGFARVGTRAVWRRSGFFYAGHTPRGLERRIWYFPGARITRSARAPG